MRSRMGCQWVVSIGALCVSSLGMAQSGLNVPAESAPWPRWQARVGLSTGVGAGHLDVRARPGSALQGARLLGDYYFSGPGFGEGQVAGGLRATSGWLIGGRSAPWGFGMSAPGRAVALGISRQLDTPADDDAGHAPYVGIGYTGLSSRGGWGFSADIGVVALNGGGLRVGRMLQGMQRLDDAVRDLRLSPMLQVGASYSF